MITNLLLYAYLRTRTELPVNTDHPLYTLLSFMDSWTSTYTNDPTTAQWHLANTRTLDIWDNIDMGSEASIAYLHKHLDTMCLLSCVKQVFIISSLFPVSITLLKHGLCGMISHMHQNHDVRNVLIFNQKIKNKKELCTLFDSYISS